MKNVPPEKQEKWGKNGKNRQNAKVIRGKSQSEIKCVDNFPGVPKPLIFQPKSIFDIYS